MLGILRTITLICGVVLNRIIFFTETNVAIGMKSNYVFLKSSNLNRTAVIAPASIVICRIVQFGVISLASVPIQRGGCTLRTIQVIVGWL